MDTTIEVLLKAAEFIEKQQISKADENTSHSLSLTNTSPSLLSLSSNSSSSLDDRSNSIGSCNVPLPKKQTIKLSNDSISETSRNNLFIAKLKGIDISNKSISSLEFHQKPIKSESSVPKKSLFNQSNSIDLNNNDANYHDAESKSPINMYSTSPSSSFSCSSSDSSIFSLSNISYSNKEDKGEFDLSQIDANSNQNFESDKYKPEDIKRNKMIHNILEKNRRAHLKECFESLQYELPQYREKKVTNLLILKQTIKYVEQSKRIENEYESEIKKLLNYKSALLEKLNKLRNENSVNKSI